MRLFTFFLCVFILSNSYAVPLIINSPVSGTGWSYNQHNPGGYYNGIGEANDGYSWDINYGSGWDDDGLPVYAVESGCIHTGDGWGGTTYGQLLINHTTNNVEWSSGYLHMQNIVKKSGCFSKGDKIGEIHCEGLTCTSPQTPHLHFAVYNSHGQSVLSSVNTSINKPTTYPLTGFSFKDFWVKTGTIYEGVTNGFDAQFKIVNESNSSITITGRSISLITTNGGGPCWDDSSLVLLSKGSTNSTGVRYCTIPSAGDYDVIAKVKIDNKWFTFDEKKSIVVKSKTLNYIEVSGSSSLNENSQSDYTVKAYFSGGSSTNITSSASWSENSSNTTIDNNGRLTASSIASNKNITVTASYTYGGITKSDTKSVEIINIAKKLSSVIITGNSSLDEQTTSDYQATAKFDDNTTLNVTTNSGTTWNENSSSTTINNNGRLTAGSITSNKNITVTASYTYGGITKSGTKSVEIKNIAKTLNSVIVRGISSINENSTSDYTARAYFSDSSNLDITATASWSDNSSYATISNDGELSTFGITENKTIQVEASYTSGGVTKKGSKFVTINNLQDKMFFVEETIDDNTVFSEGIEFQKSWTLRNDGNSIWTSNYCLRSKSGTSIGTIDYVCVVGKVSPGESYKFQVPMQAPAGKSSEEIYQQFWTLTNNNGDPFGYDIWVKIKVRAQEQSATTDTQQTVENLLSQKIILDLSASAFTKYLFGEIKFAKDIVVKVTGSELSDVGSLNKFTVDEIIEMRKAYTTIDSDSFLNNLEKKTAFENSFSRWGAGGLNILGIATTTYTITKNMDRLYNPDGSINLKIAASIGYSSAEILQNASLFAINAFPSSTFTAGLQKTALGKLVTNSVFNTVGIVLTLAQLESQVYTLFRDQHIETIKKNYLNLIVNRLKNKAIIVEDLFYEQKELAENNLKLDNGSIATILDKYSVLSCLSDKSFCPYEGMILSDIFKNNLADEYYLKKLFNKTSSVTLTPEEKVKLALNTLAEAHSYEVRDTVNVLEDIWDNNHSIADSIAGIWPFSTANDIFEMKDFYTRINPCYGITACYLPEHYESLFNGIYNRLVNEETINAYNHFADSYLNKWDIAEVNKFTLSVNQNIRGIIEGNQGNIQCGNNCFANYSDGSSVELSAMANNGYYFAGWSGHCSGNNNPCHLVMEKNEQVSAIFSRCITLEYSWIKEGDIYTDTPNNFDAQFKLVNHCSSSQSLKNSEISFHHLDDGSYYQGCFSTGTLTIPASGSYTSRDHGNFYCTINKAGNFKVIQKMQLNDGSWIDNDLQYTTIFDGSSPQKPLQVIATDGLSTEKVTVSWNSVDGVDLYKIFRCSSDFISSCLQIGTVTDENNIYFDITAIANVEYFYRVKSYSTIGGDSEFSAADIGWRLGFVVTPPNPEKPTTDFTSVYQPNTDTFTINWQGNQSTDQIIIYSSFDKFSWTQILSQNLQQGSQTLTISESVNHNQIYFKVTSTDTTNSISYTSNPELFYYTPIVDTVIPKETEVPNIPQLSSLGQQTSNNYVKLYWQRVNDSNNKDNVSYYEVKYADNYSFNNATIVNAGNNAAGVNIYESVSYTIGSLIDEKKYYFKVRAINGAGTSSWSAYQSITINIEDFPYFDTTYQQPNNASSGVSKTPILKWRAYDKDGDDLEYYVVIGESSGAMTNKLRSFNNDESRYFDFNGSGEDTLKPGTTYYWQVWVKEQGHDKAYYGGEYIKSPIWSFTTSSAGSDLAITNVEMISELKPDTQVSFKVSIKNIGTEVAHDESIRAYYKKNGQTFRFRSGGNGYMQKKLLPNETEDVVMTANFRGSIITYNGVTYDNILIEGDSYLIFDMPYLDNQDVNPANNTYEKTITYTSTGKPVFSAFYLVGLSNYNNLDGRYVRPNLGDSFRISFNATDDLKISKATVEYKITESDSWHLLTTYINEYDSISEDYYWNIPENTDFITNDAQIRVRVYENDNSFTEKVSYPFPIESNLLELIMDDVQSHQVGDKFSLGLTVTNDYPIKFFQIKLFSNGKVEELYEEINNNGINIGNFVELSLPNDNRFANVNAYLEIRLNDTAGNYRIINSNTFDLKANTKLDGAFGNMIDVYNTQYSSFPAGSTHQSTDNKVLQLDVDDNNIVHMIVESVAWWWGVDSNGTHDNQTSRHFQYFYLTYNYDTKQKSTPVKVFETFTINNGNLPSQNFKYFKMVDNIPSVLAYDTDGNILSLYKKTGSTFSNQIISSSQNIDSIEIIHYLSDAYVHYRYLPENGVVEDRRHKVKKIFPTLEAEHSINPGEYLGSSTIRISSDRLYVPYLGKFYNLDNDLYVLSLDTDLGIQSKYFYNSIDLNDQYKDMIIDSANNLNLIAMDNTTHQIFDISDDYNLGFSNSTRTRVITKLFADIGIFGYAIKDPDRPITNSTRKYKVSLVDLNSKSRYDLIIGDRINEGNIAKLTSINSNKIMAIGQPDEGSAYLAVADFSKDVIEPQVNFINTETSLEYGQTITLNWTASDNDDELLKYEIVIVVNGVETLIETISNTQIRSYNYILDENTANLIELKIKAYDLTGNIGTSILPLDIVFDVNFASFTANKSVMNIGEKLIFSWSATDATPSTEYSIFRQKVGSSEWIQLFSVTGEISKSYIVSDFVGEYKFKIVSGNYEFSASNTVLINGELLKYNENSFKPDGVYYGDNTIKLEWTDTLINSVIPYTILVKKEGDLDFSNIGETVNKYFEYVSNGIPFIWKISAIFDNKVIESNEHSVTLQTLEAPQNVSSIFTMVNSLPQITITFDAVTNAQSYIITRESNGYYQEIATITTTSFTDSNVQYGITYQYSIIAVNGEFKSVNSGKSEVNASLDENYTVSITNTNYQSLNSNSMTLTYVPSQSVSYEKYEIRLGKASNNLSTYAFSNNRSVFLSNLDYGQTYYIEVYPVDYLNTRLTSQPAKLTFSTAFDTRVITTQPLVTLNEITLNSISFFWDAVTDADYYYICRSENGGDYSCFDITFNTNYTDYINLIDGNSYRYIVKAVNGYSSISSRSTSDVVIGDGSNSGDICQAGALSITSPATYTTSATIQSDTSIFGNTTIVVNNGVSISYNAPTITLKPGFHAQAGSQFTAKAMTVNCAAETLTRSSANKIRVFSAAADERTIESDISQVKEYLIPKWLNKTALPLALQQILNDKDAIAQSLQTDASGEIILFSTQMALVDSDINDVSDIYVYHTPSEILVLISATDENNAAANGASTQPMINGSGEFILYSSEASDLISLDEDTNQVADIYLYHIASQQTFRVSSEEDGSQTSHASGSSSLSGDEPYIVYDKASDSNQQHVYGVDTSSNPLSSIKFSNDYNNFGELISSYQPGISSDGRFIVYLEISPDNTCQVNIQDQISIDFIRIQCPEAISKSHHNWKSLFDSTSSKIQWYNQTTGDKLNMVNPLFSF